MTAFFAGQRLALARIARLESALGVAIAFLAVMMMTVFERRASNLLAADRALGGIALGIVLPLLAYGWTARACGGTRLDVGLAELARHGANRKTAALGVIALLALVSAIAGGLLAFTAVLIARAPADPALARDAVTSTWIGGLAGACYAAWFALGSTLGQSGGGRFWLLAVDWVLGAGSGALALPWPRAHVQNLLGGVPLLDLPQAVAVIALVVLAFSYTAITLLRAPS